MPKEVGEDFASGAYKDGYNYYYDPDDYKYGEIMWSHQENKAWWQKGYEDAKGDAELRGFRLHDNRV
jgi:hypothetical protein